MATCPDCGGFLNDRHLCGTRWWRVRAAFLLDLAISGGTVGLATGVGFYLLDRYVSWPAILLTAFLGMVIRWALIVGEPRRKHIDAR